MDKERKPQSSAGQTLQKQTMGHSEVTHGIKPQPRSRAALSIDENDKDDRQASPGTGTAARGNR